LITKIDYYLGIFVCVVLETKIDYYLLGFFFLMLAIRGN